MPVAVTLLNRTPITAVERPAVGQRLCKIGSFTGISCGTVTKVTSRKVHFDAFNRPGDSGGPVYRDNGDGTVPAVAVNSATPDVEADCQIDHTGEEDCGGTAVAELILPWMNRWGLTIWQRRPLEPVTSCGKPGVQFRDQANVTSLSATCVCELRAKTWESERMAGGNLMHWIQQLDELEQVVKNFADTFRRHPRQDEGIVGDVAQTVRETTPGDYLRDLPRLDTADDPELHRTSSALAQAIRVVTTSSGRRWNSRELVPALDEIYAGIAPMRAALTAPAATPATLESIVAELRNEFTLSLAVMLSGQYAVVTKLYEWYSAASGVPEDAYLDVRRFEIVKQAGPGCIPMRDLEIATHGGVTMLTPQTGFVSIDRFSPVQQLLYGQWFAYMHSLWDEQYRGRVAAAHGTAPDGSPWDARDIRVPLFGDIRRIRNDFIHNKGIVDKASETEVLTWFTEGEPAAIKPEQMMSLLTMFPESDLFAEPTRAAQHSREPLPWSAEPALIKQVQKRARHLGLNRKTRKEIGADALELWLATNPAPATDS